jgi:translation elongation factor EF-1beta
MLEIGADLTETIEKAIAALSTEDLEISAEVINMDFQEMQEAPKKKEAAPPAAAEEEEEEEAPKPKAEAKYMRVITWEIVPANTDADFNQCIEQIKSIQIEGVQWTGTPSVVPHVFGLSKIVIVSNITCDDDKSDAIMAAVEKLSTEETEFSAEAVNIDFQEMQAPPKKKLSELDQLKAELEAEKKKGAEKDAIIAQLKADIAAAQGGGKKAAGGKPAAEGKAAAPAKEAKEELPAGLDRKLAAKCEQDGSAKASELKKMHDESGNKFFAANVEGPEGNVDGLVVALKAANKKVPTLGKIFISGGLDKIAVAAWVPADEAGESALAPVEQHASTVWAHTGQGLRFALMRFHRLRTVHGSPQESVLHSDT